MKTIIIPGYRSVFGEPTTTYEQLLKGVSSVSIINFCAYLNTELRAGFPNELPTQQRLFHLVSRHFSPDELAALIKPYAEYMARYKGIYQGHVFGKQFLLSMIARECHRNDPGNGNIFIPGMNFFKAYLLVADELKQKEDALMDDLAAQLPDHLHHTRMIWMTLLPQMKFNEDPEIFFQFVRLLRFLVYARKRFPDALAEYCSQRGFTYPDALVNSVTRMMACFLSSSPKDDYSNLSGVIPDELVPNSHLEDLCINHVIGKSNVTVADLKKYPLVRDERGNYRVIELTFFARKMFRGVVLDLFFKTSLAGKSEFESYFNEVAHQFMEKVVFNSVMSAMVFRKSEITCDDSDDSGAPDFYYRNNHTLLLTEFKAYLFPERLLNDLNWENFLHHINERFITTAKKPKALHQLARWIGRIDEGKFAKDPQLTVAAGRKKFTVYPILCVDDFHYTITGLNEYLNNVFEGMVKAISNERIVVKPLTLISLSALNHYRENGGELKNLPGLLDRYRRIIDNRGLRYAKTKSPVDLIEAKASFDEVYASRFQEGLKGFVRRDVTEKKVTDEFAVMMETLSETFND